MYAVERKVIRHHKYPVMMRKWRSQSDFPPTTSPVSLPPDLSALTAVTGHLQNVVFVRLAPVLSAYTSLKNRENRGNSNCCSPKAYHSATPRPICLSFLSSPRH